MIKRECKKCGVIWSEESDSFACECGETFFFAVKPRRYTENDHKPLIAFPCVVSLDLKSLI